MNPFDAERLGRLAHALHASPRQLLVLAARIARVDDVDDPRCRSALAAARRPCEAAHTTAMLLMTPVTSFAQDDLAAALALPPAPRRGADA